MRIKIDHIFPQYTEVTNKTSQDKDLRCYYIKVGFTAFIRDDNQFDGCFYLNYSGNISIQELEREILQEIKESLK